MKKALALILAAAVIFAPVLSASAYEFYTEFPSFRFDAVVTVTDGAVFVAEPRDSTDEEKFQELILTYGTEVTITGEATDPSLLTENGFDTDGVFYAIIEYGSDKGYIDMSVLKTNEEPVPYTEGKKLPSTNEFHVLDPDGVVMYEGPSRVFNEVTTIPYGADIEISYADKTGSYMYAYTEYKGKSGWIYAYAYSGDCALARPVNESSFYTGKAKVMVEGRKLIDIYDHTDEKYKTVSEEIPVGTELTFDYYSFFGSCAAIYTSYKGVYGWMFVDENYDEPADSSCMIYYRDIVYLPQKTEIYDEPGDVGKGTGKYISANSLLNCDGHYFTAMDEYDEDVSNGMRYWALVEYNGKQVWITTDGTTHIYTCEGTYSPSYASEGNISIYEKPSTDSDVVDTANVNDNFTIFMYCCDDYGDYWDYVNYNGVAGWIQDSGYVMYGSSVPHALRVGDDGIIELGVTEVFNKSDSETEETTEETSATEAETESETENNNKVINQTAKGHILVAVIAAGGALGIVAVAVIVILVRKRDKKLDEGYQRTK